MKVELETKKYISNPLYVNGLQVTPENLGAVSKWCRGRVHKDRNKQTFIKVPVNRPANEKQTRAYPTDWVLKAGSGFKVYSDQAFRARFKEVPQEGELVNNGSLHLGEVTPMMAKELAKQTSPG